MQEKKINTLCLRCFHRALIIEWQLKTLNEEVLIRTGTTALFFYYQPAQAFTGLVKNAYI